MDEDPPKPQDQGQDVVMVETRSDSAPHGGQEQGGQPDQEPLPNPEALDLGKQEGQQLEEPADIKTMQGDILPLRSLRGRSGSTSSKELVSV